MKISLGYILGEDETSFKGLFNLYYPPLCVYASRYIGDPSSCEDIVQEAYLKLWDKRDTLDIHTNPAAYCTTLVRHLALDQLQTKHYTAETSLPDNPAYLSDWNTEQRLEARDQWMHLKQLIAHLPATQRTVLWLRDVQECSMEEIARSTGLTDVNIRSILSRTRKKLREQFNRLTGDKR